MATPLRNFWQSLAGQRGSAEPVAQPRAVEPASQMPASPLTHFDIAPNDPLVAYFQSIPGAVEIDRLQLDSPALAALKAAGVKMVMPLVSQGELVGLLNLGPRIGKFAKDGQARAFKPHNLHLTLMGLMLIFTGFYGFYAACLVIQSTTLPGWGNIYLNPTTLSAITFAITIGFAGGFTGGYFASRGDPFWTLSGGLAGVISVSAGADIYAPSLDYLISIFGGALAVYAGNFIEKKLRIDDAVGAVAVHGVAGFWSPLAVGLFAAGYPTGLNNIDSSLSGQLYGMMVFLPLGFFGGYIPSWILKKANLLRVPPEVELEGLDMAEFQTDFYPEFGRPREVLVLPDGTEVDATPILLESYREVTGNGSRPAVGVGVES